MMNWITPYRAQADDSKALTVNVSAQEDLLRDLKARMRAGQGFCLATLNLDHVVKLRRAPEFLRAYQRHSHVTADGNPIVWLSQLAGHRVGLIPGSELIAPLSALAAEQAMPLALLGATQETLDEAVRVLERDNPGIEVVAKIAPPMGFDPTGTLADDYIKDLQNSGARVCFIALGAPKQEIFAAHAAKHLPQVGFLSIGAGLDFIAGTQKRAPALVRGFAAEWLWRLAGNPRRLAARYGACIGILPVLTWAALQTRLLGRAQTAGPSE